jgi:omega-amidase
MWAARRAGASTAASSAWHQWRSSGAAAMMGVGVGAGCCGGFCSSRSASAAAASSAAATPPSFKLACIQLSVGADKEANLASAKAKVAAAAAAGAELVMLPEIFNSPYSNDAFPVYAEELPPATPIEAGKSPSATMLREAAREHNIFLVGGSVPEREGDRIFNTCMVFGPTGELVAKHRKTHLFDIDIPGKMTFKESETLTGGNQLTLFEGPHGVKAGVAICYDMRFPEMAQIAQQEGARVMLYPAAFNTTTGPHHWELLQRARAIDNLIFVATASPARSESPEGYQAWGHSTVVDPWGEVVATTEHTEDIVYAQLDFGRQDEVRGQIPILTQKRTDVFSPAIHLNDEALALGKL